MANFIFISTVDLVIDILFSDTSKKISNCNLKVYIATILINSELSNKNIQEFQ
jgi:hypothetical protein